MLSHSEDIAEKSLWISLSLVQGVGSQTFCQLLKIFASPSGIYAASTQQLKQVVSDSIATKISLGIDEAAVNASIHWLSQANNYLITLADSTYPKALLETPDPPPIIYAKGNPALLNYPSLAIVGSRNASVQGEKNAEAFAEGLCAYGLCIISGLALGIDGAAHRGALKANGATIAVVGTGLDIIYPAKHRDLAHQIAAQGLIISEFPLGTASMPQNFPRRNRIISGLSLGCLVVEANLQSGSQITARLAAEQGREVFAIPGSIHSPMSKGCHQLIKQGAKLVDCLQDIVEELGLSNGSVDNLGLNKRPANVGTAEINSLLKLMGYEAISLESLVRLSHLTVSEVSSMLMLLELEGSIASLSGGQYQKIV
jgi:DNA processing protein